MALTLAVVLGIAGSVLVFAGLIGGGFRFSGISVPVVGWFVRLPCVLIGAVFILFALSVEFSSGPGPVPTPEPAAPPAPPATVALGQVMADVDVHQQPTLGSPVVMTLRAGEVIEIHCTAQGEAVERLADGVISSLWNGVEGGFVPDVLINTGTDQATAGSC
ncbi:hypothetical protein ACFWNN_40005 [Lentzea sp. NPDC058450]|uniref:hypothetical protein n=1 Tax=Lentzea sp. NPDC058450 TaxID=3346505 RepID=UPI0036514D82